MSGNAQAGLSTVAELLARRWSKDRAHFTLFGNPRGVALHSSWLRRGTGRGLDPHWYLPSAAELPAAPAGIANFPDTWEARR